MKVLIITLAVVAASSAALIGVNLNDGRYYPDYAGVYIHDNSGAYIPDNSGAFNDDGLGRYTGDNSGLYVHQPDPYAATNIQPTFTGYELPVPTNPLVINVPPPRPPKAYLPIPPPQPKVIVTPRPPPPPITPAPKVFEGIKWSLGSSGDHKVEHQHYQLDVNLRQ